MSMSASPRPGCAAFSQPATAAAAGRAGPRTQQAVLPVLSPPRATPSGRYVAQPRQQQPLTSSPLPLGRRALRLGRSRGLLTAVAASQGDGGDSQWLAETSKALERPAPPSRGGKGSGGGMGPGVFSILALNFLVFGAGLLQPGITATLPLSHWAPRWWQFVTAAFAHANWEHLSSNAFSLLVFGRMVEEEEGAFGVWLTYLLCGVGGTLASYLSAAHTHTVSLGASSAVFGLFVVGVVAKFKPSPRRLLEAVILGQFVVKQVLGEVQLASAGRGAAATLGGMQVGHVAHLAGAAVGVLLVLLLARLPEA